MDKAKKKRIIEALKNVLYPLVTLCFCVAVWAIYAEVKDMPYVMPSPWAVFKNFFLLFAEKSTYVAVGDTLLLGFYSFALSFAVAFVASALANAHNAIHRLLSPLITVLRAAPTMVIILLIPLWLDYRESAVLIGFLISFPLLYSAFYSSLGAVNAEVLEMTKLFKVNRARVFFSVKLPLSAPLMLDSIRRTVSLNIKVIIAAEVMLVSREILGIGRVMSNILNYTLDISMLLAWTLEAILLSFVLEALVGLVKIVLKKTRLI